jgi:hypothetical protein
VAADGTVTDGPPVTVGGLTVIEVPSREEAHKWAAKWAAACRCDQEIWERGFDPKIDAMLRQADNRKLGKETASVRWMLQGQHWRCGRGRRRRLRH